MFIPLVKRNLGASSRLRSHVFWEYIGLKANFGMQVIGSQISSGWDHNLCQKNLDPQNV